MIDLSPEARRMLAQAKAGQARAPQALRARVKETVARAIATDAVSSADLRQAAAGSASVKLSGWVLPSLLTLAAIGGIAGFVALRPAAKTAEQLALPQSLHSAELAQLDVAQASAESLRQQEEARRTPSAELGQLEVTPAGAEPLREQEEARATRGAAVQGTLSERAPADVPARNAGKMPRSAHTRHERPARPTRATRDASGVSAGSSAAARSRPTALATARAGTQRAHALSDPLASTPKVVAQPRAAAASDQAVAAVDQAPAVAQDQLRAEMQLLSRAQAALRKGDPQTALAVLQAHAQQFQGGQLFDEREGLRLIALCALERDPAAALTRYLHANGDGVLHARVRAACLRFVP